MKKAWIENGVIFVGPESGVPPYINYSIDIPDDVTPLDLKIVDGRIVFKSEEEKILSLKEDITKKLLSYSDFKVQEFLNKNGYRSIGDLKLYAELEYSEAQNLLNLYLQFDNELWNFITNILPEKTLQELKEFNPYVFMDNLAKNIFGI